MHLKCVGATIYDVVSRPVPIIALLCPIAAGGGAEMITWKIQC